MVISLSILSFKKIPCCKRRCPFMTLFNTRMHSSRMRTARPLIVSPYLVVSHACPPPREQPCMPPPGSNYACPPPQEQPCTPPPEQPHVPLPRSNHACPPEQPCTPPQATMHAPLGATMHAPLGATMHAPPGSNYARPPCGQNDRHVQKHNLRKLRLRAVIIQTSSSASRFTCVNRTVHNRTEQLTNLCLLLILWFLISFGLVA